MDHSQCLAYLDRLGNEVLTMRLGLKTMRHLLQALDSPHRRYASVLIAGTNGKGSVARFLRSMLSCNGYRTGLFTSPHVVDLEERFVVDDYAIRSEEFARHFTRVAEAIEKSGFEHHPTYFETLTATAFVYFAEKQVDIAVLEVGLGGRLDSTNVVEPVLSVITPIGLDHQQALGHTIEQIASEKAGIIHSDRPVLISKQRPQARQVVLQEAANKKARVIELDPSSVRWSDAGQGKYSLDFRGYSCRLPVNGRHQVQNAAIAIEALTILDGYGFPHSPDSVPEGIRRTRLLGVIEKVGDDPMFLVDGGHNQDAAEALAAFVEAHSHRPRSLVLAMMRDKEVGQVLRRLQPLFDRVFLTQFRSERAATVEELKRIFPSGIPEPDPIRACERATVSSATVVAAGSFYLVGEILGEQRSRGNLKSQGTRYKVQTNPK